MKPTPFFFSGALFCGVVATTISTSAQVTFTVLGNLPGDFVHSYGEAVSHDGEVVVGYASSPTTGGHAFRWSEAGGMAALDDPTDAIFNPHAEDVSSDGSVVVGIQYFAYGYASGFRWDAAGGIRVIPSLNPTGPYESAWSDAKAVSGDGQSVVGQTNILGDFNAISYHAYRWTAATGVQLLFDSESIPGFAVSDANAVSADGEVVGGFISSAAGAQAYRWTEGTGIQMLGDLTGGTVSSRVSDMSADGSVLVGKGSTALGDEAFRWTADAGLVGLGVLPGATGSQAVSVSADGSVVMGYSGSENFIWDAVHGLRSLDAILASYGVEFEGWDMLGASAMSGDATTLVGSRRNSVGEWEAWRLRFDAPLSAPVPEPATLTLLAGLAALAGWAVRRRASGSR